MKNRITLLAAISLGLIATPALADHHGHHGNMLHKCLKAASKLKEGYYAKVEYLSLTDKGGKAYEIEIKDPDGVEWEVMCSLHHAEVMELEREVASASDPLFSRRMKVDEKTASETALAIYPGKLVHTEYEIEPDGTPSYEFDIWSRPGVTFKIEVSAETGAITEYNVEAWDIGREEED
ncbi:MAG: peptidase [Gammaproteobacteria bacterium]|nr:MAG: peptidase [Gammaproteobacteria bacterium]